MPVETVTRRIRSDGDERGMLVYGYPLTASGAPRVSGHPKGVRATDGVDVPYSDGGENTRAI
jgi:hypothetical protein